MGLYRVSVELEVEAADAAEAENLVDAALELLITGDNPGVVLYSIESVDPI